MSVARTEASADALDGVREHYESVAKRIVGVIEGLSAKRERRFNQPPWRVEYRVKDGDSIARKLERKRMSRPEYLFEDLTDLLGVRVLVESVTACRSLEAFLRRRKIFSVLSSHCEDFLSSPRPDGYRGLHLVVEVRSKLIEDHSVKAEIQIRTFLQHQWAILSHAEFYKSLAQIPPALLRRMRALSDLLSAADIEADELRRGMVLDELVAYVSGALRFDVLEKLAPPEPNNATEVGRRAIQLIELGAQMRAALVGVPGADVRALRAAESLCRAMAEVPAARYDIEGMIDKIGAIVEGMPREWRAKG